MKPVTSRTLAALLAAAGLFGASMNAQAATTTSDFTVTINLTSACQISAPPANITLNYTAFGPATNEDSAFAVRCTNSLPYTLSLGNSAAYAGTLVGVNYELSLLSGLSGSTEVASATTTTSSSITAGPAAADYRVRASIAGGQAGTCGSGTCTATSASHTLTISY